MVKNDLTAVAPEEFIQRIVLERLRHGIDIKIEASHNSTSGRHLSKLCK